MTTGDVVYSLRFSLIIILPEPGFDLGSTAGESNVLTARLHMLYTSVYFPSRSSASAMYANNNIDRFETLYMEYFCPEIECNVSLLPYLIYIYHLHWFTML